MTLRKKGLFSILAFVFFLRVVIDPDLGWHLRVGELIWRTGLIPKTDFLSFSLPDYPYVYHSWLTETFLYYFYSRLGLWGVTFFYAFLLVLVLGLVLKTARLRVKKNWVFLFLLLVVPFFSAASALRSQIFTFLGLALTYFVFRKYLEGRTKLLYLLPVVFAFWANLHGGFFLGLIFFSSLLGTEIVLLSVQILANLLEGKLSFKVAKRGSSNLPFGKFATLGAVLFLCLGAVLINPYGGRIYEQALSMGTNRFASQFNLDWQPLVTQDPFSWMFALSIFVPLVWLFLFRSKVELREKIVLAVFFALALRLKRFSMVLLIVLVPALVVFLEEVRVKAGEVLKQLRFLFWIFSLLVLLVFGGRAADYFLRMRRAYKDEVAYAQEMPVPYAYPAGAVDYLRGNPIPGRILNDYNWGGYLVWKLPERKFFIDGRMDNFFLEGESFGETFLKVVNLEPGWEEVLEDYEIGLVLVSSERPLVEALRLLPEWALVYSDETSVLFKKQ
jgi:hypothetical protein